MRGLSSSSSCSTNPFRLRWSRIGASLVAGNVFLSGAAFADYVGSKVVSVHPQRIEVLGNGVAYTQPAVPLVSLSASLVVDVDAQFSGRIKSWKTWIGASPQAPGHAAANVSFNQHPHSESYPLGSRPKTVATRGVHVTVPYGTLAPFLTEHCNWLANKLRSQGMSNQTIFSVDRTIPVRIWSSIEADISGMSGTPTPAEVGSDTNNMLDLVCKAGGGVNPDIGPVAGGVKAKTEARLTSVNASVLHDSHPASCPTQAMARVTFVSDTEGPFTWRFTSASGKVSPPIRMEMRASDKQGKLYIRSYDQKFMIGEKVSTTGGGGSGGGIGGSVVGGGLAGTSRPDPSMPGAKPAGPAQQQVGGGFAAPSVPRLHQDALRAVVLNAAPGSVERSDAASYQVQCPVVQNPAVGMGPGGKQGPAEPTQAPSRPTGVLVPGAVKTAPPVASQPPGVRRPVAPAKPVAHPPVPTTGEASAQPGRQSRIGAWRRQAAEEDRAGVR